MIVLYLSESTPKQIVSEKQAVYGGIVAVMANMKYAAPPNA